MSYGYFKEQTHHHEAIFHLFFRKNPFAGNYAIACGLGPIIDILQNFTFSQVDIEYLKSLTGNDQRQLFSADFLKYLEKLEFTCDLDAVVEGTPLFPHEPILRIRGPIIQCQILETILLNIINFQTLIATKAARIKAAAGGDPVMEFGLRRAQGIDGALSASRAAFIGGTDSTSNVLAGKQFGIPVKGTHAHSWVMSFPTELESFQAYAKAMPNNCIFLVDTYDTIEGIKKAILVAENLREQGHEMLGIRLDSGDMTALSIAARELLDGAGFAQANIVASNDLDEYAIAKMKKNGAKIDIWGVGTKLVTAYDQPALGGVYKLAALRQSEREDFKYTLKLSEDVIKISNPGSLQIKRIMEKGMFSKDILFNTLDGATAEGLLIPIFRRGKQVYHAPSLREIQAFAKREIEKVPNETYPVELDPLLLKLKLSLMNGAKEQK